MGRPPERGRWRAASRLVAEVLKPYLRHLPRSDLEWMELELLRIAERAASRSRPLRRRVR